MKFSYVVVVAVVGTWTLTACGDDVADPGSGTSSGGTAGTQARTTSDGGPATTDGGTTADGGDTTAGDPDASGSGSTGGDATGSSGSGSGTTSGGALCSVPLAAQELVDEVVFNLLSDGAWVAPQSQGQERAYAISLVGTALLHQGTVTLIASCTAPSSFDPYCELMDAGEAQCTRFGCDAADIGTVQSWWALQGNKAPGELHTYMYDLDAGGTATYDPNPSRNWVVDESVSPAVISVQLDHAVTVDLPTQSFDLSHVGELVADKGVAIDDVLGMELNLTFPALASDGAALAVVVSVDSPGVVTGTGSLDGQPVVSYGSLPGLAQLESTWQLRCD